jgi:hypothetical protein
MRSLFDKALTRLEPSCRSPFILRSAPSTELKLAGPPQSRRERAFSLGRSKTEVDPQPKLQLELQLAIERLPWKSDPDEDWCIMPTGSILPRC